MDLNDHIRKCVLIQNNLEESFGCSGNWFGGETIESKEVGCVISPSPFTSYGNSVYRINIKKNHAKQQLEELKKRYEAKKAPCSFFVSPLSVPQNLPQLLSELGLKLGTKYMPALIFDLNHWNPDNVNLPSSSPSPFPSSAKFEVMEVKDNEELVTLWIEAQTNGWDDPLFTDEFFGKVIRGMKNDKRWKCYVGMLVDSDSNHKKGVCACITYFDSNSVLGFYKVVTVQQYRKKGYAMQMMRNCIKGLKESGHEGQHVDWICLESTDTALNLYKLLGFVEIFSFTTYILPIESTS